MSPLDIELMERWTHQRDPEAFKQLTIRYGPMVYGTCLRILRNSADAEDAVQDCFLKLVKQHTPLRSSLAGWLHRVAVSCALDRLQSRSSHCFVRGSLGRQWPGQVVHRARGLAGRAVLVSV